MLSKFNMKDYNNISEAEYSLRNSGNKKVLLAIEPKVASSEALFKCCFKGICH